MLSCNILIKTVEKVVSFLSLALQCAFSDIYEQWTLSEEESRTRGGVEDRKARGEKKRGRVMRVGDDH